MSEGIIGKKLGMTQVYSDKGKVEGVTAIEAGPCPVLQVKTTATDGYNAAQLGFGTKKAAAKKPAAGKGRSKDKKPAGPKYRREFRIEDVKSFEVGKNIDVTIFKAGDMVDITGISKGRGFAGGVKRYHFRGGPKTHGQSDRWRAPGSVGSTTTPGRVYKGLRMAGHMGVQQVTVRNLTVFEVNAERNLLFIKGAVPGMTNGLLLIQKPVRGKK
jgi:large subunit ribosomal protein L3